MLTGRPLVLGTVAVCSDGRQFPPRGWEVRLTSPLHVRSCVNSNSAQTPSVCPSEGGKAREGLHGPVHGSPVAPASSLKAAPFFTLKEGLCFPEPPSCFERPGETCKLQKRPESRGRAWPSLFLKSKAAGGWTADLPHARRSVPRWKRRCSHENVPPCRGCGSDPEVSF